MFVFLFRQYMTDADVYHRKNDNNFNNSLTSFIMFFIIIKDCAGVEMLPHMSVKVWNKFIFRILYMFGIGTEVHTVWRADKVWLHVWEISEEARDGRVYNVNRRTDSVVGFLHAAKTKRWLCCPPHLNNTRKNKTSSKVLLENKRPLPSLSLFLLAFEGVCLIDNIK